MDVKEFLNAKSMLTPGVAGLITMLITNALHAQFGLSAKWVALALSFLVGLLVFTDTAARLLSRVVLYAINSLIIFSIAVGANTTGAATRSTVADFQEVSEERQFFDNWFGS